MSTPVSLHPLEPAELELRPDGTLYSSRFEDVYASAHGALEQARHVFLGGNGLPGRWRTQKDFTIVETGFGAGLNFLATWQAFRQSAPADARLHYVSVEKHPFRREDLARIYARHPELAPLTQPLFLQWPMLVPGFHRLHLEGGRISLTLLFGDAAEMLAQLEASTDAFYLDGFAPSRNAQMWSEDVFKQVGRLAGRGATCATYTVAAQVREGLGAVGFAAEKRPGFASKRDMLAGTFQGEGAARRFPSKRHALIVGAGLAGTTTAERMVRRGWTVDLLETHATPAQEASGNPAGLIRPVISADQNPHGRFTLAGFLYTLRHYQALERLGHRYVHGTGGVVQVTREPRRQEKLRNALAQLRLPADLAQEISGEAAASLAGTPVPGPALLFPEGQWAEPASMCRANLAAAGAAVRTRFSADVVAIERSGDNWRALGAQGQCLAEAPVLVLANANRAMEFAPTKHLPLRRVRGQITRIPAQANNLLKIAVCGDGYVTPAIGGVHWVGATFNEGVFDPQERPEDHEANFARARTLVPEFAAALSLRAQEATGRVAFRTMARDRLPVVGPVGPEGLYACLALGSRGMSWSALAAELLASQVCGEPLPLDAELVAGLDPRRFAA